MRSCWTSRRRCTWSGSRAGTPTSRAASAQYESRLLRRTWRDGGTVRNETLANLSKMPDRIVDAVEAALKGQALVPAGEAAVSIARSLPHGHVAAVHAMARRLGLPALLGPAGRQRDLALALIVSRVVAPGSKLSTLAWWGDVTLGADLGIGDATTDEAYAAMDWLASPAGRDRAQARPPAPGPGREPVPDGAVRPVQLVAGGPVLPAGGPRLLPGRQEGQGADRVRAAHRPRGPAGRGPGLRGEHRRPRRRSPRSSTSCTATFGLRKMVMVGDRGMITTARIEALRELDGKYGWITALRAPAIRKLMAEDGPLQLSPVRRAGPRRDQLARFPRRAARRLPQPRPGRGARPQARGPARRHREAARPDRRPGRRRPAGRRRRDRRQGRRGHRQVQDGQALRGHHHR